LVLVELVELAHSTKQDSSATIQSYHQSHQRVVDTVAVMPHTKVGREVLVVEAVEETLAQLPAVQHLQAVKATQVVMDKLVHLNLVAVEVVQEQ
jgi:hypothetical protein